MIKKSDIIADLHTHTIYSEHAYSTVKENAEAGMLNGMKCIAITDHLYKHGDDISIKNERIRIAYLEQTLKHAKGIKIISGCEMNLNHNLNDGCNGSPYKKLEEETKWRLLGFHSFFLTAKDIKIEEVPQYFEQAMKVVKPTAFAHIEREIYKCIGGDNERKIRNCLGELIELAKANNIFLEINESSIEINEHGGIERMHQWIEMAKEQNVMFSLGSDSHYCDSVGHFENAIEMINYHNIPVHKILNTSLNIS